MAKDPLLVDLREFYGKLNANNNTNNAYQSTQDAKYQFGDTLKKAQAMSDDIGYRVYNGIWTALDDGIDYIAKVIKKPFENTDFAKAIDDFVNVEWGKEVATHTYGDPITIGKKIYDSIVTQEDAFKKDNAFNWLDYALNTDYTKSTLGDSQLGQMVQGGADSLGRMIPALATFGGASSLGASAKVAEGLSLGVTGITSAGSSFKEAVKEGASENDALIYGALSGGTEVATEKFVGWGLNKLGLGTNKIFGVFGKDTSKNIASKSTTRLVKDMIKTFNEEGMEEVVSDMLDPIWKKLTYKPDGDVRAWVEENGGLQHLMESYLVGGTMGIMFDGAKVTQGVQDIKSKTKLKGSKALDLYYTQVDMQNAVDAQNKLVELKLNGVDENSKKYQNALKEYNDALKPLQSGFEKFVIDNMSSQTTNDYYEDMLKTFNEVVNNPNYSTEEAVRQILGDRVKFNENEGSKFIKSLDDNGNVQYDFDIDRNQIKTIKGLTSVINEEYLHKLSSTLSSEEKAKIFSDFAKSLNVSDEDYKTFEKRYAEKMDNEGLKGQDRKTYLDEEITLQAISSLSSTELRRIVENTTKRNRMKFFNTISNVIKNHTIDKNYSKYKNFLQILTDVDAINRLTGNVDKTEYTKYHLTDEDIKNAESKDKNVEILDKKPSGKVGEFVYQKTNGVGKIIDVNETDFKVDFFNKLEEKSTYTYKEFEYSKPVILKHQEKMFCKYALDLMRAVKATDALEKEYQNKLHYDEEKSKAVERVTEELNANKNMSEDERIYAKDFGSKGKGYTKIHKDEKGRFFIAKDGEKVSRVYESDFKTEEDFYNALNDEKKRKGQLVKKYRLEEKAKRTTNKDGKKIKDTKKPKLKENSPKSTIQVGSKVFSEKYKTGKVIELNEKTAKVMFFKDANGNRVNTEKVVSLKSIELYNQEKGEVIKKMKEDNAKALKQQARQEAKANKEFEAKVSKLEETMDNLAKVVEKLNEIKSKVKAPKTIARQLNKFMQSNNITFDSVKTIDTNNLSGKELNFAKQNNQIAKQIVELNNALNQTTSTKTKVETKQSTEEVKTPSKLSFTFMKNNKKFHKYIDIDSLDFNKIKSIIEQEGGSLTKSVFVKDNETGIKKRYNFEKGTEILPKQKTDDASKETKVEEKKEVIEQPKKEVIEQPKKEVVETKEKVVKETPKSKQEVVKNKPIQEKKVEVKDNKVEEVKDELKKAKTENKKLSKKNELQEQQIKYLEGKGKIENQIKTLDKKIKNLLSRRNVSTYVSINESVGQFVTDLSKVVGKKSYSKSARTQLNNLLTTYYVKDASNDGFTPIGLPYDENLISMAKSLIVDENGKALTGKLDLAELQILKKVSNAMLYQVEQIANNTVLHGYNAETGEYDVQNDLDKKILRYVDTINNNPAFKDGNVRRMLRKYYSSATDFRAVFSYLDNFGINGNGIFTEIGKTLQECQQRELRVLRDLRSIMDKKTFKSRKFSKHLKETYKITINGKEMSGISRDAIISLYLTASTRDGYMHIRRGGFSFVDKKGKEVHWSHTENKDWLGDKPLDMKKEDSVQYFEEKQQQFLNEIIDNGIFTTEDMEYINSVKELMEKAKIFKGQTDMALYGSKNVINEAYFPLAVREGNLKSIIGNFNSKAYNSMFSIESIKYNKARNNNFYGLQIYDASSIVNGYMRGISKYCGYAVEINWIKRMMNTKVKNSEDKTKSIKYACGEKNIFNNGEKQVDFESYLAKLVNDVQGIKQNKQTSLLDKTISFLRSNSVIYNLGWSMTSTFRQACSYIGAGSKLSFSDLSKGMLSINKVATQWKTINKNLNKYSPYLAERFYNEEILKTMSVSNELNRVQRFFMKPNQFFDQLTIKTLYFACENNVKKNNPNISSEELIKKTCEKLEEVVRETQPNFNDLEKSALQRSDSEFIKSIVMYSSQPVKNLSRFAESIAKVNALNQAIKNYDASKQNKYTLEELKEMKAKAVAHSTKVSALLFAQGVAYTMIGYLVQMLLNKKKKEEIFNNPSDVMADVFENSFISMLPFVKEVYQTFIRKKGNFSLISYENISEFTDAINDITNSIQKQNNGEYVNWNVLKKELLYSTSKLVGLPVKNLDELAYGVASKFDEEQAYTTRDLFTHKSSASSTRELTNAINNNVISKAQIILNSKYKTITGSNDLSSNISNELLRLYKLGYHNVLPSSIDNNDARYKQTYSRLTSSLSKVISSSTYKSMSDENKAKVIKSLNKAYYEVSRKSVEKEYEITSKLSLLASNKGFQANLDIYSLALIDIKRVKSENADKSKDAVQKYINKLSLSKKEKLLLYKMSGYSLSQAQSKELKTYLTMNGFTKDDLEILL